MPFAPGTPNWKMETGRSMAEVSSQIMACGGRMKSCNLAAKSSDESRFSLPLTLRMAEKRRVCGLVGGGQDWMWVARVLKRSENSGAAKPPSLRTVSQEACSALAWNPGGTSTAVGCNYWLARGFIFILEDQIESLSPTLHPA